MRRWLLGFLLLTFPGCASAATTPAKTPASPQATTKTQASTPVAPKNPGSAAPTTAASPAPAPATNADASAVAANEGADPDDDELADDLEDTDSDGEDHEQTAQAPAAPKPNPLLALTTAELESKYKNDPKSVGPLSLGAPNAGALVNGVQMPKSEKWILQDPSCAYGTQETVDAIAKAIEKVAAEHPGAPPLPIGHISARKGGHLSPHRSHQAGRDVDLGYYHDPPKTQFVRGTDLNLDLERTYALVKIIVTETDTELVLIDTAIQRLLVQYGQRHGEDEAWLDQVFQVRNKHPRPLVRHARGHGNHLHVRFVNPVAQTLGRRAEAFLKREKVAPPHIAESVVTHKARSGDTLQILAKRYGTTVEAIQSANGLKTIDIKMGRTYRIPVPKPPSAKPEPPKNVTAPKRRVPQPKAGGSAHASASHPK